MKKINSKTSDAVFKGRSIVYDYVNSAVGVSKDKDVAFLFDKVEAVGVGKLNNPPGKIPVLFQVNGEAKIALVFDDISQVDDIEWAMKKVRAKLNEITKKPNK